MYYGIDALLHGATAAIIVFVPSVVLFWWMTRGLAGSRPVRPFVTVSAAYGIAAGGAGLWAGNFERPNFVDEAMTGALIAGALLAFAAFLILLLFPRKA